MPRQCQFRKKPIAELTVNAAENPAVHRDAGPVTFLFTVLRSCPLYDTIAILIVLLQVPPAFLTLIHLLFATLTFVPPSTGAHSSFTFTDIFEGSLGTPSVATLVAVDLLVLLVWLFLWSPLQDLSLDVAQTVIALTLGGGTTSKDAGFNNVLVCLGIIGASHFARNGSLKQSRLSFLFNYSPDVDDPLENSSANSKGAFIWVRTILAVHILTQGIVRYIRDWYMRRERRDLIASAAGDPEAANGAISQGEPTNQVSTASTATTSAETNSSANTADKSLNPKKKRKVGAQVRIQQPLWAALASTKVVMAKEYETSRTAAESAGANATDINNLGNAPFDSEADRIWITHIGSDEVCFNTSYFPSRAETDPSSPEDTIDSFGVDRSKPFFVRVNKTVWQPTRINPLDTNSDQWSGEIFGLAPNSNYECEFVGTLDDAIIFSTNVRTMPAPATDATPLPALSTTAPRSARPDSPTTTLKTSILSAEAKLNEERLRQKRERKEQKSKMHSTRKEIDKLGSNIASSGGNDDRLRQKVQQSHLHARQAEDAVASLTDQLRSLEDVPDDDFRGWKCSKVSWQSEKDIHKASRSKFHEAKVSSEHELHALTAEVTAFLQKRERMQSRISKLNGEFERITDANARGLDEAQRKATERGAKEAERARTETMYLERLDQLEPQFLDMQQSLATLWASIHALQNAEIQQAAYLASQVQQGKPTSTNPIAFPDNVAASNYPWNAPNVNVADHYVPSMAYTPPRPHRGRSSSMLSGVTGLRRARMKIRGRASGTSGSVSGPRSPVETSLTIPSNWSNPRDGS
ncbi:hypothetical protein VE04_04014 [Pseudogymnoascus sp. 24MN13]|nr:hypothetical protein VE04_04014 [Pseudogymnoascus sp. 24MN13]